MKNFAQYFRGFILVDEQFIPDAIGMEVTRELETISHTHGGKKGELNFAVGSKVTGEVQFTQLSAQILALFTGGSISTGTNGMIPPDDEHHTIATNIVTLANAANLLGSVYAYGSDGTQFEEVDSSPAVGEYSLAAGVLTFNTSETDTDVYVSYFYSISGSGETVSMSSDDLPAPNLAFRGSINTKNLNASGGGMGHSTIYLAKINITGSLKMGGTRGDGTIQHAITFEAEVADDSDFTATFPA